MFFLFFGAILNLLSIGLCTDTASTVIYTDIGRDGMLSGVNIEATVKLARALTVPVIASGGVTNLDDVTALCAVQGEGIQGAITGRAVYQGTLDFAAAQKLADNLSGSKG